MSDAKWLPEVDPNPAEPRMVIWSTLRCLELQIDQHEELHNSNGVVSWELLKHMVRLAKRHAHEEGGKAEAAERETDQWRTRADEANAKLRETEQELDRLRRVHMEFQSTELTEARATIADLQQQLAAARAEIETLRGAMAADDQRLRDAEERAWPWMTWGCDAPDKMADEILHLREQLAAANAAVTLQRAGIERLQKCVGKVRTAILRYQPWCEALNQITAAHAELDAGTEPTPVAERCPECDGSGMVDSGGFGPDGKAISVPCGGDCRGNPCPSQPAPVAEPVPCRERELSEEMQDAVPPSWAPLIADLRRRLRESQQELERLQAFVAKARQTIGRTMNYCDVEFLLAALAELDTNSSVTLTSSPTPVAETLDAEGGK